MPIVATPASEPVDIPTASAAVSTTIVTTYAPLVIPNRTEQVTTANSISTSAPVETPTTSATVNTNTSTVQISVPALVSPTLRPVTATTATPTVAAPVSTSVPIPVATPTASARVTTADIMTMLAQLDQKMNMMVNDITRLTADNVAIRHDLVVCVHVI